MLLPPLICVLLATITLSATRVLAATPLPVVCTDQDYRASCVQRLTSTPFDSPYIACAHMTAPFIESVSTADVTDGYTCYLFPKRGCVGERLTISGTIPTFVDPATNFNDKALTCIKNNESVTIDDTRPTMLVYGGLYRDLEFSPLD
ncbi:hypothetical protein B0H19DRAFT_1160370 [Mycena capillaripes]|nr:hypothetical protein B0H19DRAFT_1160370 [Mycena capillaripes]